MPSRFTGLRAVVTGASRGIGAATAERLAAEGADLLLVARTLDRHPSLPGSLRETAERLSRYGTRIDVVAVDLAEPEERSRIVTESETRLDGPVDILVNNAAAAIYQPLLDYPLRRRHLTFEVNVQAPLELMQAVVPGMRASGRGWIVNVTSSSARLFDGPPFELVGPGTDLAVYAASKAALNRISNAMGAELYGSGIRVNAVQPRAAVLSEGAAVLVGDTIRPDQVEQMEEMVEAVTALCAAPTDVTGRVYSSLGLVDEFGLTVRGLDNQEWTRPEVPA
jgi:citronellol/citronellal dehydrogenase